MRQVREVMRLHREGGAPMRGIGRMMGIARSTVRDMVVRFDRCGLSWPVPPEISDAELEGILCKLMAAGPTGSVPEALQNKVLLAYTACFGNPQPPPDTDLLHEFSTRTDRSIEPKPSTWLH